MSFDPIYDVDRNEYSGMFKTPSSLAGSMKVEATLLRDHFYLNQNNSIALAKYQDFFKHTVVPGIRNKRNVIAVHFEFDKTGLIFKKKIFTLIIAIIPGALNQDQKFSHDHRDGFGSAYLSIGYLIRGKQKLIEEKIQMYSENKNHLRTLIEKLIGGLTVESSRGIAFSVEEHFHRLNEYEIVIV